MVFALSFNLVEEIFLSFYEQFEEKQIDLQFPEPTHDRHIIADPLLMTRVIQNIVQNILRYANSQAVIRYRDEGNDLILSVKTISNPTAKLPLRRYLHVSIPRSSAERIRNPAGSAFICLDS